MFELQKSFRGYNCTQVDEYLKDYQEQLIQKDNIILNLQAKIDDLNAKLDESLHKNEEYFKLRQVIQESIVSAKTVANQMVEKANKECDEKLHKTEASVQKIISQKNKQLDILRSEYGSFVEKYSNSINTYKELLESQLKLVSDEKFKISCEDITKVL